MHVEGCQESNGFQRVPFPQLCFGDPCRFSSHTSQDREVTNGLTTHDNSSGVTTARGLDMETRIANVETRKLRVALDPHCCSKSASQLVARPSQNIACGGLLCSGMDSSGREKVERCFAAVVGEHIMLLCVALWCKGSDLTTEQQDIKVLGTPLGHPDFVCHFGSSHFGSRSSSFVHSSLLTREGCPAISKVRFCS